MFKIFFEFVANYFRSCFNYFKQERKETIFKIQQYDKQHYLPIQVMTILVRLKVVMD